MSTTYPEFVTIFTFLVRSHLDSNYISKVDASLQNNEATAPTTKMVKNVREFHAMRRNLIQKVYERTGCESFVTHFVRCIGIDQYNCVPEKSICAISHQTLAPGQGILVILRQNNGQLSPHAVHTRFKRVLHSVWFLIHLPQEIMITIHQWLRNQLWWQTKTTLDYEEVVRRIVNYNDGIFIKKCYVKLKDISNHLQSDPVSNPTS
jgi:hypothetical protein